MGVVDVCSNKCDWFALVARHITAPSWHFLAKVLFPNWKMAMRAIDSCSSTAMGASWKRHRSTDRLQTFMPQAAYQTLLKATWCHLFHFVSWNNPCRDGAMPMRCMSNVNTMNLLQTFAYFFVMGGRGPISIANAAAGNLRPLFVLNLVCLLIGIRTSYWLELDGIRTS